jgi:hypothetical protein
MKKITLTIILIIQSITYGAFAESLKIDLNTSTKYGHTPLSYKQIKLVMFSMVDNIDGMVCSVYTKGQCQKRDQQTHFDSTKKRHPSGFKLNIEHTWPQSKGAKKYPAKSDMYHLFVTTKASNSKRSNLPFCIVEVPFWELGGSAQGIDYQSQDCFEPRDIHKGNVARAMFYFSIRYELPINEDQEVVLRKWHDLDPVDEREIERAEIIKTLQGNSNPFINDPSLVDLIKDF